MLKGGKPRECPWNSNPEKKKNSAQKQVGINNRDAVCRNQRQNVHELSVNTLSSTSWTKSNHNPDGCCLEKKQARKKNTSQTVSTGMLDPG